MLSAYEFARHFHLKLAKHPLTPAGHKAQQNNPSAYHAGLTKAGANKVGRGVKNLIASVDYQICEEGGNGWFALGQGEHVQRYRNDWIVVARKRPNVPVIYGAQGSQTEDEQAKKILVLFFPWVNNVDEATPAVPFIGNFWQSNFNCWRDALRARVFRFGFPTEEVKRYVLDFCFVYCLPRSLQLQDGLEANSDNEGLVDDEQVTLDQDDLLTAMVTHVKGAAAAATRNSFEAEPAEEEEEGKTNLYNLTMDMLHRSDAIWGPSRRDAGCRDSALEQIAADMQTRGGVRDHNLARQAAAASRRKEKAKATTQGSLIAPAGPSLTARPPLTAAMLYQWLESEPVRQGTNPKQFEFLQLVVDRILVETGLIQREQSVRQSDDPLVWLLHGPPGTGKSHVLGFIRQLFELVGYTYGLHYEAVAFQAVNAAPLKGKTIPSAFGFDRQKQGDRAASEEVAKKMAHWRWLILDEVSLTDAKLLAQMEQRLRFAVPGASSWRQDLHGRLRPFGGVNVIFAGDFYQLPPPAGHYLANIPRNLADPNATSKHDALADQGQQLLWGGPTQGVTELTERERCKDDWWNEVIDEMRAGRLSDINWQYLHGRQVEGCHLSAEERASRQRVLTSFTDPRLRQEKFKEAIAIVANNDARYQINKRQSQTVQRSFWKSIAVGGCRGCGVQRGTASNRLRQGGEDQVGRRENVTKKLNILRS